MLNKNVDSLILKELNSVLDLELKSQMAPVKSNVTLASAITAYTRIHIIKYKLDEGCVYSDTDSIFTTSVLPDSELGFYLGLFKNEMDGLLIQEGCFLGIKIYGYWYFDKDNNRIEKSTFAGVTKNSLSWEEVLKLLNGVTITKYIPARFFKSFKILNIKNNDTKVSVKFNPDKTLFLKLFNKIKKFIKYFIK